MAITTLDGYIAAAKQRVSWKKEISRTAIAFSPETVFDVAGWPKAGTLSVGDTANGLVHTSATLGYPFIKAFAGGTTGYITRIGFMGSVVGWVYLYDRLFVSGAHAYDASPSLSSQPSFSARVPGGTDFVNTQIWIEAVTAFTGSFSIAVTYTDQAGNAGHTTGTVATGIAPILGRCIQIPLASGDTGVSVIEGAVGSVSSAGTYNLMVLRPLWNGPVVIAGGGDVQDLLRTGMIEVFADSALYPLISPTSTATGIVRLELEIASA